MSVIESELGKLDFLADYHFALRGERAQFACIVDYARKNRSLVFGEIFEPRPRDSGLDQFGNCVRRAAGGLIPAGWFEQNKLSLCRLQEKYLVPLVDEQRRVVSPAACQESESVLFAQIQRPSDMLSKVMLPGVVHFAARLARAQASVDLARVACALERYRLANGRFPETLAALAPQFIQKLPHDVINGQPLKYHRSKDGQFVLYSVGWNQTDEGGKAELTERGSPNWEKGDWVWRYSAVPKSLSGKKVTVNGDFDLRPLQTTSKPVEVQL